MIYLRQISKNAFFYLVLTDKIKKFDYIKIPPQVVRRPAADIPE